MKYEADVQSSNSWSDHRGARLAGFARSSSRARTDGDPKSIVPLATCSSNYAVRGTPLHLSGLAADTALPDDFLGSMVRRVGCRSPSVQKSMEKPNKPDAVNPAMALWLTTENQWPRVTDLERSALP